MNVNLIVAVDKNTHGIGKNGRIPWNNKDDMKWLKNVTTGDGNNSVIMGRTTYESIGKPLPNRINIVITHKDIDIDGCIVCHSIEDAISYSKEIKMDSAFILGGGSIYKEAISKDLIDILYVDFLNTGLSDEDFDTYFEFPPVEQTYRTCENLTDYNSNSNINPVILYRERTFVTTDYDYLSLMNKIIKNGKTKHTRAGETLSIFGEMLSFDLRKGLPILTTKKVYSKGCIHELLWILHGNTNIKYLVENNTHIWDDDAYRYYLQKFESDKDVKTTKEQFINRVIKQDIIHYVEDGDMNSKIYTFGDLGPVYGKQWVNWNGINQVKELIHKLKTNPDDRRLMISAWNVGEIKDMALPPCHYLSQWYVTEMNNYERNEEYHKRYNINVDDNKLLSDEELDKLGIPHQYLSCMWMQRSVDTCLGLPYDLLSYSILTHLIAQICNMVPYEVKCSLGDCHIYKNQLSGAIKQIQRNPFKYEYAQLVLNKEIKDINDFKYDDIKIVNYNSYSTVKYPLSVGL